MECIKSTSRSALVAFAPDLPYMAAGTMSGAVDLSFSSSANLEIFELDFTSDDRELPIVGSCPSADRFNRLSWSKPIKDLGLGLVAGGLGDGTIGVWNPDKLIHGSEDQTDAFVAKLEKHTGPVRGLEFNSQAPHLLLSGADEGEICIWNLAKPLEPKLYPSLRSTGSSAQTEISSVSWNPEFQHILASTSFNGISVVWDLRQQKPVTSFSDSTRRRGSVLQWNPDISTHLIVASDDDSSPSLRVWDVRKTISPLREFVGHTKGVIAMSWCPHDSAFLLTCAKDNRTICWDTNSGEIVSELPASTNGNFDVHWYPKIPGVISASSFDQKVGIYNIQACNRYATRPSMESELTQGIHMRAPKWLKRPTGASFGFGGKLVSFQTNQSTAPNAPSSTSEVYVHNLVTEQSLVNRSTEFEATIQDGETSSLLSFCEKKYQDSLSEDEKETWGFLKVMFEEDGTARTKLVTYLGFDVPNEGNENEIDETGNKLSSTVGFDEKVSKGELFPGEGNEFLVDNGEDFFNNPQHSDNITVTEVDEPPNDNQIKQEQEIHIESAVDPAVDATIQRALVVGDYRRAVLQCINASRMADALVIAHVGGSSLWEITRDQYLKNSPSSYLKVVSALVTNDMTTLINTRPLDSWKETLAMLCTFAQKDEWSTLCDILASRLARVGNTLAATLCYMCAGNIDKTVEIWSHSLKLDQDGKSFVDLLQDLMEKTRVLAFATGQKGFSTSLSKLVEKYAELLSSQGLLTTAMDYLKLLESDESSYDLAILRDRLAFSVAEKEPTQTSSYGASTSTSPYDQGLQQANSVYATNGSNFAADTISQSYYQPQANIQGGQYVDNYQQPIASNYGYQHPQQTAEQKPLYSNAMQFQPTQPTLFQPAQPTLFQPAQPTLFQPAQPTQFQPAQPTQFQPAQSTPFQPAQPTQFQPAQSTSFQPAQPTQFQPTQPTQFQPAQHSQFQPTRPTQFKPAQSTQFQPMQPTFMSALSQQVQSNFNAAPVPAQRSFTPANPPALKNVHQYQQPSLGSHLYSMPNNHAQPSSAALSQVGTTSGQMFPQTVGTAPSGPPSRGGFMPAPSQGFAQRPGFSPQQPSSPTIKPSQPVQAVAPPAPPPTVQTVDTSNVPANLKPVINTLTKLYHQTSEALGGSHANASKKREIEDNSRKIGALFAKLNSGDISPNAAAKLTLLCQALDNGDTASALHIQVILTTSEWDECNFWLAALKRMIKLKQSARI